MARYKDAVCRLCRREGTKLFLKGAKCFMEKCPVEKRNFAPGQHGKDRKAKIVGYGLQLREKQKAKRMYFAQESQFRNYFEKAARAKGVTGEILLQQLERRLDSVVFRLGFAVARRQARQLVRPEPPAPGAPIRVLPRGQDADHKSYLRHAIHGRNHR